MLSDREIKIIKFLYSNRHRFCTSQEIGENVGVSEKTIRTSINNIIEKPNHNSFKIISKKGSGFKISIINNDDYIDFIYNYKNAISNINQIYDKEGREKFILENLLLKNNNLDFYKVLDILYISESTLNRDIYNIRDKLKDYSLYIDKNQDSIISVVGKEVNKRHFILDYFFSDLYSNNFIKDLNELELFNRSSISQILIILLDEIREFRISVNDYTIQNLVIHLALLIERVEVNCIIKDYENPDVSLIKKDNPKIYRFASNIINRISKSFDISLPENEQEYIYLQLISKTKSQYNSVLINNKKIIQLLSYLSKKLGINLLDDKVFINNFMEHLSSLENRIYSGLFVTNPLTKKITNQYKYYYNLVVESFRKFSIFENDSLTEDEWSYIVIYILSAIERKKSNIKRNVLVVCASGLSTGLMLKSRIENEYGNNINIKEVIGYYEIGSQNLNNIDFIISTVDLDYLVIPIPYVKVSIFLDENDCKIIDEKLKLSEDIQKSTKSNTYSNKLIDKYFLFDRFCISNESKKKEQILDFIYHSLTNNKKDIEKYRSETIIRESFGSVVFNNFVALPHPVNPIEKETKIFIYISKKDIFWDENNTKVRIIIYISPSSKPAPSYEYLLGLFTKIIKDEDIITSLINVKSFDDFKNVMINLI
ncbi:BglG family transcription antiterminator [Anaerococcus sp. AGMB00486]|uniref:BglG family transcription antiterminator n=1 Tax=Anaerococcus faecalis TaxID=2742993 RepID=A0ABX2NC87_9FIRM|nr:PRD domain-containing protein [Anaerococcus faecalis]NVF12303.1 BglG family transcription antiterminator [Anaerococcus faecalis]